MMNLHRLVRSYISTVNMDELVVVLVSNGFDIVDFEQKPIWKPAVMVLAQIQPVPDEALQMLNQQREASVWRDMYLDGDWRGIERSKETSGALIYWDGYEWEVDQILEGWGPTAGWTKLRVVQVRACDPPEIGATEPPTKEGC